MRGITVGSQPCQPSDLNLTDVLDVIRHADPVTFQEFFAPHERMSNVAAMAASFPPSATSGPPTAAMMMPAVAVPGMAPKPDLGRSKKHAYVRVTEQPASKGLRFRYECEGRSAGSIPGVSSTIENKTFPTIQVVGYQGRAVVVVSCVTVDAPYRPHPHNLVGKEGCKKGVCTIEMDPETMSVSFPSLGIQCVKKKEIEASLQLREQIRVDPFQTGFSHRDNPQMIDLNCVRLCFQVFLEGNEKGAFTFALKPVVSDPIYDKKARNDLTICRMTECSASVAGGKEILIFCEKVTKDDIQVRFYEEDEDGNLVWEGFGEFQPSDVHKQYGICFKTPRYHNLEIDQSRTVRFQLRRPSDGAVSDSRSFEFLPIDGGRGFWAAKRMKTNYNVFSNILALTNSTNGSILVSRSPLATSSLATSPMDASTASYDPNDHPLRRKVPSASPVHPSQAASTSPTMTSVTPRIPAPASATASTIPPPPPPPPLPQVPSSHVVMLRAAVASQAAAAAQQPLRVPPKSAPPVNLRPLSGLSDVSSVSCSTATTVTGRSLNDILSLAGGDDDSQMEDDSTSTRRQSFFSDFEIPNQPSDNISIQRLMAAPSTTTATSTAMQKKDTLQIASAREPVKPVLLADKPVKTETVIHEAMDVDMLYDDVLQCVYDDVDTKYDDVVLLNVAATQADSAEPPVPPARKQRVAESANRPAPPTPADEDALLSSQDPEKPLPDTPSKVPAILTKFTAKKNPQSAKELEEQKKKEKAEKEAEKQREKEEKEKEKILKKQREEAEKNNKKKKKQKSSEETTDGVTSPRQSLFQRLFSRSKSGDEEMMQSPNDEDLPPVPAHGRTDGNGNPTSGYDDDDLLQIDENADLSEIQQLIDSGNLDQLDNMVSEFAREFVSSTEEDTGNNNNSNSTTSNNNITTSSTSVKAQPGLDVSSGSSSVAH